jgi:hypothetical protein
VVAGGARLWSHGVRHAAPHSGQTRQPSASAWSGRVKAHEGQTREARSVRLHRAQFERGTSASGISQMAITVAAMSAIGRPTANALQRGLAVTTVVTTAVPADPTMTRIVTRQERQDRLSRPSASATTSQLSVLPAARAARIGHDRSSPKLGVYARHRFPRSSVGTSGGYSGLHAYGLTE